MAVGRSGVSDRGPTTGEQVDPATGRARIGGQLRPGLTGRAWLPAQGPRAERTGQTDPDTGATRIVIPPPVLSPGVTDYTTVSIPKELADRVEETIDGTSFSSTSDLVRFLLRSIVVQHQRGDDQLTEAEFADIASQLKDLGYLE
jgi:Arc/MetJ-type ribon-helix-helix transcriptional regulator